MKAQIVLTYLLENVMEYRWGAGSFVDGFDGAQAAHVSPGALLQSLVLSAWRRGGVCISSQKIAECYFLCSSWW
jgi:hypothetical protein